MDSIPSGPAPSGAFAQVDMGGALARHGLPAFVPQRAHVDVVQEMLPGAEQDRPDREMQFVDETGAQELSDRGHAAAQADVAIARGGPSLLQGGVDPLSDEVEGGAVLHGYRGARMWRHH